MVTTTTGTNIQGGDGKLRIRAGTSVKGCVFFGLGKKPSVLRDIMTHLQHGLSLSPYIKQIVSSDNRGYITEVPGRIAI